jgi:hypothetical protein
MESTVNSIGLLNSLSADFFSPSISFTAKAAAFFSTSEAPSSESASTSCSSSVSSSDFSGTFGAGFYLGFSGVGDCF